MKITIGGYPGSGKSTVGRILAEKLRYEFHSMGSIRRKLAEERGLTIEQFNVLPENTDILVDDFQKKNLARQDNIIVEGRVSFHFIADSAKIMLTAKPEIAAARIFNDPRKSEKRYSSVNDCLRAIHERIANDKERYRKYYNIDAYDAKHFDVVIDTSALTIDETIGKVMHFLASKGIFERKKMAD